MISFIDYFTSLILFFSFFKTELSSKNREIIYLFRKIAALKKKQKKSDLLIFYMQCLRGIQFSMQKKTSKRIEKKNTLFACVS